MVKRLRCWTVGEKAPGIVHTSSCNITFLGCIRFMFASFRDVMLSVNSQKFHVTSLNWAIGIYLLTGLNQIKTIILSAAAIVPQSLSYYYYYYYN